MYLWYTRTNDFSKFAQGMKNSYQRFLESMSLEHIDKHSGNSMATLLVNVIAILYISLRILLTGLWGSSLNVVLHKINCSNISQHRMENILLFFHHVFSYISLSVNKHKYLWFFNFISITWSIMNTYLTQLFDFSLLQILGSE